MDVKELLAAAKKLQTLVAKRACQKFQLKFVQEKIEFHMTGFVVNDFYFLEDEETRKRVESELHMKIDWDDDVDIAECGVNECLTKLNDDVVTVDVFESTHPYPEEKGWVNLSLEEILMTDEEWKLRIEKLKRKL